MGLKWVQMITKGGPQPFSLCQCSQYMQKEVCAESGAPAKELKHTSSVPPASRDLWPPATWEIDGGRREFSYSLGKKQAVKPLDADGD